MSDNDVGVGPADAIAMVRAGELEQASAAGKGSALAVRTRQFHTSKFYSQDMLHELLQFLGKFTVGTEPIDLQNFDHRHMRAIGGETTV